MKATELRIGNLIQSKENRIFKVTSEDLQFIEAGSLCKPIPLTEEWLLKLGFIKDEILEFYRDDKSNSTIIIDYDFICLLGYSHVKIKYVHQLQNLYFALTNNEIEIL